MIHVLLVDDEPALCEITKIFLEREGGIVVTPSLSAEEALQKIGAESFDVIVSDYEMPGMSGIDLLKALNALGFSIPVIIFTGRGREEVVIEALNNGAEYYLQKGGNPRLQFTELRYMILKAARNRRTEQKLADREAEYRDLFQNMLDGFDLLEGVFDGIKDVLVVQKPDHTIVRFNRAGSELLDCTPADAVGKTCYELIGRSEPCEVCTTQMALESGHLEEVERFFPELGRYLVCRSNPIIGEGGEVRLVVEQLADISERKRIEMALQQANKKLNILNSITRHDILNWMTALLGYLEIEKDMVSDLSLLEIIEKEETAAVNIKRLITFTREYQDIGVNAPVWQDVERVVRSAVRHQGLKDVAVEISAGGIEVYADPMFVRVIENLIDNSVRHGEHVTAIRCAIEKSGSGVRFVYEDNGIGIPDPEKPLLFKQGYGKNTGFGLFLSKEILSITDLSIAEEGEYGQGARFVITIPPVACRAPGQGHE